MPERLADYESEFANSFCDIYSGNIIRLENENLVTKKYFPFTFALLHASFIFTLIPLITWSDFA